MVPIPAVLSPRDSGIHLDTSGLAGFFGEDEAIAALNTMQIYPYLRFMGFYNAPGSLHIARHYGQLVGSRILRGFFPRGYKRPDEVFGLDGGEKSPRFLGAQTGLFIERTGHLGYLFYDEYSDLDRFQHREVYSKRETQSPTKVTIVTLGPVRHHQHKWPQNAPCIFMSIRKPWLLALNFIPVACSIGLSVTSALAGDWFVFSLILAGSVVHGLTSLVLGSGKIKVSFPNPQSEMENNVRGDGMMVSGNHVLVILGEVTEVNMITQATIEIQFPDWVEKSDYGVVGICCLASTLLLLMQIFLVAQATLFGQILFLISFGVSWLFNTYLASIDKNDLHKKALDEGSRPKDSEKGKDSKEFGVWNIDQERIREYTFQNRIAAAIAMLYILEPAGGWISGC
ncbi:hypothetical protein K435DRAFT_656965 [Dendrothele bispora CBS 962.96]|uniref:Uncharacterized protein n=1 Tax=Dendrothele bispora (strain CBS 962.96) TaxID=1314807 RepID=A0A4S8MDC8_DENBC|nr:hypothetical protein K435DRAFT_656965 [Dendrothele bispora CBS 962.96]